MPFIVREVPNLLGRRLDNVLSLGRSRNRGMSIAIPGRKPASLKRYYAAFEVRVLAEQEVDRVNARGDGVLRHLVDLRERVVEQEVGAVLGVVRLPDDVEVRVDAVVAGHGVVHVYRLPEDVQEPVRAVRAVDEVRAYRQPQLLLRLEELTRLHELGDEIVRGQVGRG